MNARSRQLSLSLEEGARGIAEWAVSRYEELDETLPDRYGPGWRRIWAAVLTSTVRHLAQAVAFDRPELFVESVSWVRGGFHDRNLSQEDFGASLQCLLEVVKDLPSGELAADALELAISVPTPPPPARGMLDPARPADRLALEYLEAILSGRRADAEAMILKAASNGMTVGELYLDVLQPAQAEIGALWHGNEISIAEEHSTTAVTESVVARLRSFFPTPETRRGRAVAASVGEETHALGLRMVADFLEMDGWDMMYLGVNLPGDELIRCVAEHQPDLMAISVTSILRLRAVADTIGAIRANFDPRPHILVGGAPFNLIPDLWQDVGADGSASTAREAVDAARKLLGAAP